MAKNSRRNRDKNNSTYSDNEVLIDEIEEMQVSSSIEEAERPIKEYNRQKCLLEQLNEDIAKLREEKKTLKEDKLKIETEIRESESAVERREIEISNKENAFLDRERRIIERENEAERGFVELNKKALAALVAGKNKLEQELINIEASKITKIQEIDLFILNYREKELEKLRNTYEQLRKSKETEIQQYIKESEKQILEHKKEISDREANIKNVLENIEVEQKKLETEKKQLRADKEILILEKSRLKEINEQEIAHIKENCEGEIQYKDKIISNLTEKISRLTNLVEKYETAERSSGGKRPDELVEIINNLRERVEELENELREANSHVASPEIEIKAKSYDEIYEKYRQSELSRERSERELLEIRKKAILYNTAKESLAILEKKSAIIEAQIEQYDDQVTALRKLYARPEEEQARRKDIEAKGFFKVDTNVMIKGIDEIEWLDGIYKSCQTLDIDFKRRLLYSFHTALKTAEWSPITVLAGVSGTGKSLLPKLYSRFGGLYFLSMPVQPDWDSSQSIFGYFNSLDNKFNPTSLLKSMVQFEDKFDSSYEGDSDLSDKMLLVLLDEMNLAHVELYFSELLSKLEERRGETNSVGVEIDLGGGFKYDVNLSRNILWVGTMNEDETTKSLSDKVIDRSNLISFPRPTELIDRKIASMGELAPKLERDQWNRWCEAQVSHEKMMNINKYKKCVEDINDAMEKVGRALGHRVWQSMKNYISNHPLVISASKSSDENVMKQQMEYAFEESLVYKVMPKLRGIEINRQTKEECFEKIQKVIDEDAPHLREDFEMALNSSYGLFVWNSSKFLELDIDLGE